MNLALSSVCWRSASLCSIDGATHCTEWPNRCSSRKHCISNPTSARRQGGCPPARARARYPYARSYSTRQPGAPRLDQRRRPFTELNRKSPTGRAAWYTETLVETGGGGLRVDSSTLEISNSSGQLLARQLVCPFSVFAQRTS